MRHLPSRRRGAVAATFAALAACAFPAAPPPALQARDDAPAGVRGACELTERKCTRCHTADRILVAPINHPAQWTATVEQMRHLPDSGISPFDADVIARCLVFRSFGPSGLAWLAHQRREAARDR